MKSAILQLVITAALFACNAKPATDATKKAGDSSKVAPAGLLQDSSSKGYPYWDSSMSHNGTTGFIDTFSVDGVQFRVVHNAYDSVAETGFDGELQKLSDNQWQNLASLMLAMHNDYSYTSDVNGDGYKDFINYFRYGEDAYLYDPSAKSLDTSGDVTLVSGWTLIDTAHNIYCDDFAPKGMESESTLYTFKGLAKVQLYRLDFENGYDEKEETKTITNMNLFKAAERSTQKEVFIKSVEVNKSVYEFEFDYIGYWRKNYKELLGYK